MYIDQVQRLVERLLVKRRIIFSTAACPRRAVVLTGAIPSWLRIIRLDGPMGDPEEDGGMGGCLRVGMFEGMDRDYVKVEELKWRLKSPYWTGFVAVDVQAEEVIGIGWVVIFDRRMRGDEEVSRVWYDNYPMVRNEARLAGDFVIGRARGHGVGSMLNASRIVWAFEEAGAELVSVVVEATRKPALAAQGKFMSPSGSNYLGKLVGRNIVSIGTGRPHSGVWYVGPGNRRRWHIE